jgi:hypothetical protein
MMDSINNPLHHRLLRPQFCLSSTEIDYHKAAGWLFPLLADSGHHIIESTMAVLADNQQSKGSLWAG